MKLNASGAAGLGSILVVLIGGFACGSPVCTDLACESNLTFDFDGEYLAAGDYEVIVESSNGEAACELTVHEDRSSDADCSGDFEIDPSVRDVVVYDTPETASLEITQEGERVTHIDSEPEYSDYYPNGPDCDAEACQVAFVTAELPEP